MAVSVYLMSWHFGAALIILIFTEYICSLGYNCNYILSSDGINGGFNDRKFYWQRISILMKLTENNIKTFIKILGYMRSALAHTSNSINCQLMLPKYVTLSYQNECCKVVALELSFDIINNYSSIQLVLYICTDAESIFFYYLTLSKLHVICQIIKRI